MSQNVTPEMLGAFAEAVMKAAHEILGANGVRNITVALDTETYYGARMEFMRGPHAVTTVNFSGPNVDHSTLEMYGGFVTVKEHRSK